MMLVIHELDILRLILEQAGRPALQLQSRRRERLAPQKVPRFVLFVDDLPHTPTHKIAKAVLRKDATLKDRATDLQRAG